MKVGPAKNVRPASLRKPGRQHVMQAGDYRALAEFRYQLRRFVRFSEESARNAGLEPQQHQLLLAITGMPAGEPATVKALAERLQLRQNSVVELIDRCALRGLVERSHLDYDRREVMVTLTPAATTMLRTVSNRHRQELEKMGPGLLDSLQQAMRQAKSRQAKSKLKSDSRSKSASTLKTRGRTIRNRRAG